MDCGREWNALGECHCRVCHEHFAGYTAADIHLTVKGEEVLHRAPGEILSPQTHKPLLSAVETPLGRFWRAA